MNWRVSKMAGLRGSQCAVHALCRNNLCLSTKEGPGRTNRAVLASDGAGEGVKGKGANRQRSDR